MAREDELAAKKTFAQLKPVCVDVLRSLSVATLGRLDETLQGLHQLTSPLVEYILFPLRTAIRRLGGSDRVLLEAVLSSLSLTLSRVPPSSLSLPWDIYQELFVFLSMLLDSRMSEEAGFGPLTEERTLRTLMALQALLLSGSENSLFQLYQNLPAIGHCVSVTVSALQDWESRELRKVSLLTLLALTGMKQADIAMFTECGTGDGCEDSGGSLKALRERVGRGDRGRGKDDTALYIGAALASFLPGVTTAISKLLTTVTNPGQDITTLCLLVWARVVCLVMDDGVHHREELVTSDVLELVKNELLSGPLSDPPNVHTSTQSPSHAHGDHSLVVERSREWRVETDRRLSLLAHKMVGVLVAGDRWRARRGLVLWAHCLLGNCHRSLVALAPIILETLLSLSHDGYQQVATAAHLSLELFSDQHAQEVGGELASVLEERLYTLASSLPRLMRQHDDVQKISTLQLLAGFLQLLGPHTLTLTHSHAHLSRIIQALIQTLEVDPNDSHILEEVAAEALLQGTIDNQQGTPKNFSSPQGEGDSNWWTLSLRYKHFRLSKVETLVQHCCQLLGHFGSLPSLLDYLLDLYRSSAQYRSELLIIIGHTLLGAGGRGCVAGREKPPQAVCGEEVCALVDGVLEEVTGDSWRGGDHWEGDTHSATNTLLQCLQLQVVGVCVRLLQRSFLPHLQSQAYLLLARAGSPQPEVASLALDTLNIIATCKGGSSLAQLITTNADYLVNCVALSLRGHAHKQEALQVLQAVLKHGAEEVLPLIRDSLDELFLCLDLRMVDIEGAWSVLRSLAAALHQWSPPIASDGEGGGEGGRQPAGLEEEERGGGKEEEREEGGEKGAVTAADVRRFFLDYHYRKDREEEAQEKEQSGEGGRSEGEGDAEDVDSKESLSPLDKAAVDVLQRCPHFLPSSSSSPTTTPYIPVCVLDCLSHCLYALRLNQQALLPEVHKVWPSFVHRLNDHSPPVALRALEVLWDMCEVCGDFVRRRVVKGVWPVIAHSLTNLSSGGKHSVPTYRYTVTYKLQQKLLESVGVLPVKLQVTSTDLETLVHACLPYLSHYQPALLQETCKTSLTALIPVDPDVMWLLLHQLVPMETISPPHPSLPPYKFVPLADGEEFAEAAAAALLQLTLIAPHQ